MLPQPLHPVVVHFPIVLVILLPLFALGALWAIRRGVAPLRAWAIPVAVAAGLAASSFVAVRTGEAEEDRVERVVPENALHEHEEAGERFLVLSGVLLLVSGVGLMGGTFGRAARLLATAGSFALIAAGIQVGDAGGDLVYRHNAGSAYTSAGAQAEAGTPERTTHDSED